ncbi:MAG: acyl--CoA ligase [Lachnospiraceae bacterium]|nr:acyl--CoA ligase [Lachnospiraceae bacterium]
MIIQPKEYFYRTNPIREIEPNQTMYTLVRNLNHHCMEQDAIGFLGTNISFATLFNTVDRLADAFSKNGVVAGDTVCICTINMPVVQECLLSLSKLGAISEWVDLRIKGQDLIDKINESKCKLMVVFDGVFDVVSSVVAKTEVEKIIVVSPKDYLNPVVKLDANLKEKDNLNLSITGVKCIRYRDFIRQGDSNSKVEPVDFENDRPAVVVQSSGSTGTPKSILHTEYNFNSKMVQEAYSDLPLEEGKCMHICVPPFIIYGLVNSVYACLIFGMKAYMNPYISETTVFDDLGKFDLACCTPTHFRYLYEKYKEYSDAYKSTSKNSSSYRDVTRKIKNLKKKMDCVDIFISGGDKLYPEELLEMECLFSKPIINGYGNNELVGAAIVTPVYGAKPESVGIPYKNSIVCAFEVDTDNRLSSGEEGEIAIYADNVFIEYIGNKQATNQIKRVHGDGKAWIHTGDLGYVDEDGYVYITGRCKRIIKRASFKIAPETIEEKVMTIDDVKDCVVVGVPDDKEMEVPFVFVELSGGKEISSDDILRRCRDLLPDYEVPKFAEIIEKIPYKNHKHNFKELEQRAGDIVGKSSM